MKNLTPISKLICCLSFALSTAVIANDKPNIILIMSDDQGWGDVAYNGNKIVKTPELDRMSLEGTKLNRFYAASPVCSPTRASVLTGRHPFRYGIEWAGLGHLPKNEITIAEALKTSGYKTAHFGKWHVGELSKTINQSYFKGELADPSHYSPPWENGFDVSYTTESMMPTYNPYYYLGDNYGSPGFRHLQTEAVNLGQKEGGFRWRDHFWTGPGAFEDEWLDGDSSAIIMDQAIKFINEQHKSNTPFLSLIWFHTPHTPLVASNEDRACYNDQPIPAQHWFGAITAMDRQIGRLRKHLKTLNINDNTILWFKSDNGPSYIHNYNSAGPFKGKKATLSEGGIRVPAIIEWPNALKGGQVIDTAMSTSDIYPTLLAATKTRKPKNQKVLDGENILPILQGKTKKRKKAIAFQSPIKGVKYEANRNKLQYALSGAQYKLMSANAGETWELYDLINDPGESKNLADQYPKILKSMKKELQDWIKKVKKDASIYQH